MEVHPRIQVQKLFGPCSRIFGAAVLFLLILPLSAAYAGINQWTSIGPEGGYVSNIAVDPKNANIVYAIIGKKIMKSTDKGGTWSSASSSLPDYLNFYSLAIDPQNPSILYVGTTLGVYKSSNGGQTWNLSSSGLPSANVIELAVDPQNPATIYAGLDFAGIYKSTNGGETWSMASEGLPTYPSYYDPSYYFYLSVKALAVDPSNSNIVYAGIYGGEGGLYKSLDGGDTWVAADTGLPYPALTESWITELVIDPVNPSRVYAVTGLGPYKTENGGALWGPVNAGLPDHNVLGLVVNPLSPNIVYAGCEGGMYKSGNYGGTWTPMNSGLSRLRITAMAIDPQTPATLYAGVDYIGVFKSTDGAANWTFSGRGISELYVDLLAINPLNPSILYAATEFAGTFKSINGGASWSLLLDESLRWVTKVAINPVNPNIVYATTNYGSVLKSTDGGVTWNPANNGLPPCCPLANDLAIDPQNPDILYLATSYTGYWDSQNGVFKSTNGGASWEFMSNGLPIRVHHHYGTPIYTNVKALAINPQSPSTVYAATSDGMFKTTDGGANWFSINSGLTPPVLYALAIDPNAPNTLYAGTNWGVYKTTNGGGLWTAFNNGLPDLDRSVYALAVDPIQSNKVYAAIGTEGVFRSTDGGGQWTAFNDGLTNLTVLSLAIDPLNPSILYAGTEGAGAFKITQVAAVLGASLIGTSKTDSALSAPFMRKSFSAGGLLWIFYSDGVNLVYQTSPDGIAWNAPIPIRSCPSGDQFSVWFDGIYAHYAHTDGSRIHYARGIPSPSGVWIPSTSFPQVAVPPAPGVAYHFPTIAVDSNGYPWIGYRRTDSAGGKLPMVAKSSRNDGIWNGGADTSPGFPCAMESWTAAGWVVAPIPMSGARMLVIYTSPGHYLRARSWDGSAWRSPVTSGGVPRTQNGVTNNLFSAVADESGTHVHLVFLETSVFRYARYDYSKNWWELYRLDASTFVPEPIIQSGLTSTSAPLLSIDSLGDLHLFWAGAPRKDHIYHKRFTGGQWEELYADWIDENVEELPSNSALSSFHKITGYVGLFYLTGKANPYNLKFGGFPSTVPPRPTLGSSMSSSPISASFQRKGFWNYGNFWVFYSDGTNMVFQTSRWDLAWSGPKAVRPCTSGEQFSIWSDVQYVYYAYASGLPGQPLYFRRGEPNFDGTIAWGPEQVAVPGAAGVKYSHPAIAVDSNGYPWIGYRKVDASNNKFPCIAKSEKNDETWKTASGFPLNLESWTAAYWFVVPVPLADGKMLAIYASHGHRIKARCWNGTAWRPRIETVFPVAGSSLSAVSAWPFPGDEAYLAYLEGSRILFTRYNFATNSFSPEEVVQHGVTGSSAPVLSYGWGGSLDLFWAGAPYDHHIFYKRNSGGIWDSTFTDWIDENVELLTRYDTLTSFYFSGNGRGLLYITLPSPPYNIKFGVLTGGGPT